LQTVVGVTSGLYLWREPMRRYWEEQRLAEEAQAAGDDERKRPVK
jgi:hypothetical protein